MIFANEASDAVTWTAATISAFGGAMALQAWLIKFLVKDMTASVREMTKAISTNTQSTSDLTMALTMFRCEGSPPDSKTIRQRVQEIRDARKEYENGRNAASNPRRSDGSRPGEGSGRPGEGRPADENAGAG